MPATGLTRYFTVWFQSGKSDGYTLTFFLHFLCSAWEGILDIGFSKPTTQPTVWPTQREMKLQDTHRRRLWLLFTSCHFTNLLTRIKTTGYRSPEPLPGVVAVGVILWLGLKLWFASRDLWNLRAFCWIDSCNSLTGTNFPQPYVVDRRPCSTCTRYKQQPTWCSTWNTYELFFLYC